MIAHNRVLITESDIEVSSKTLSTGWVAQGNCVSFLEQSFNEMFNDGDSCAVSSGTAAIYLVLKMLGVNHGEKVSVPSFSCSALLNAVNLLGANPIPIDVKEDDFTICAGSLNKLAPDSKAIIAVHCFGASADISSLKKNNRIIIEDCCQSLGGPQGNDGDASIYSFYATKIITGGQGGLVWSSNQKLIDKIRDYREFDCREKYIPRFNFQMTDIQAAIISNQFDRLNKIRKRRREIRDQYISSINNYLYQGWKLQKGLDEEGLLPYRFIMIAPDKKERDILKSKLFKNDITSIVPIEKYELLHRYLGLPIENYPVSEKLSDTCLSLPLYPALKNDEVNYICKVLSSV